MLYTRPACRFSEVDPLLRPYYPAMVGAVLSATERAREIIAGAQTGGSVWSPSLMAHVHTAEVVEMFRRTVCVPGVFWWMEDFKSLNLFQVEDVLIHVGKMNANGVKANHQSAQQDAMRGVGAPVLDFPPGRIVNLLYRLDDDMLECLDVHIASPLGYEKNEWSESIFHAGEIELPMFPLPTSPIKPETGIAARATTKIKKKKATK